MRVGAAFWMIVESVRMGIDSIRANKIRAALTILGVSIGMFVVVALAATVHGINQSVLADFESAGPTSFFIYRFDPTLQVGHKAARHDRYWPAITLSEARLLARLPSIEAVTAHLGDQMSAKYRGTTVDTRAQGYSGDWVAAASCEIRDGRDFTAAEAERGAPVVLINDKLRDQLFPGTDPIGKSIFLRNNYPVQVIGVYGNKGSFLGKPGSGGVSWQNELVVPYQTGVRHLGFWPWNVDLTVKPRQYVTQADAMDEVTVALRTIRGLHAAAPNNFALLTSESLMKLYNGFFGMFFAVMLSISAIGLLVGGIGVIAIMAITVTERTREIGIRKALGATQATILWQFLVEAATLTAVGAGLGLLAGGAAALAVSHFTPVPASVPGTAIALSLIVSAVTGMIFGLAPAVRAARLDPVEALRYE